MPEQQINIHLKLTDSATAGLRKFSANVADLGTKLKGVGRDISQVGQTLSFMGVGITAPLIASFKLAEKHSYAVAQEMQKLSNITNQFNVSIASALVPTIHNLVNLLAKLLKVWQDLGVEKQQVILKTVFLTGVFMTLSGLFITFIGRIVQVTGVLARLSGTIIALNPPFLIIYTSVIAIVYAMVRWQNVATVVLNTFEGFALTISALFDAIKSSLWQLYSWILLIFQKIFELGLKLPAKFGGNLFKGLAEEFKKGSAAAQQFANNDIQRVITQGKQIGRLFTEKGQFAKGFEGLRKTIKSIWDMFKDVPEMKVSPVLDGLKQIQDVALQVAQNMSNAFADFFYGFITGTKSLENVVADFGRSILRTLSQALANLAVFGNIQGAAGSGGIWGGISGAIGGIGTVLKAFFNTSQQYATVTGMGKVPVAPANYYLSPSAKMHTGGFIYAHSGLAPDEVPIIGQSGEGIVSRRGMAILGSDNLRRLNKGEGLNGSSGITIQQFISIQAWDMTDMARNKKQLGAMMAEAIKSNLPIRGAIQQYV